MNIIINDKRKGFLLVIIAAIFWGYMGVPTKNLGDLNFDAFSVSFFRTFIAAIFYFLYCLIKNPSWLKVDKKGFLFFIVYGIITFGGTFICYNLAVKYISIALATMFMFTSQIWVVILSYFIFKEKFTRKKIFAIILTLIGCFMMCKIYSPSNFNLNIKGVIFGLLSGITFALQIILAKINCNKYNQNTLLAYSFIFASLCLLPFINFKNTINVFTTSNNLGFIIKNIFIIGVLNTVIANGCYVKSVNYIEVGIASIIASSEIVIASIIAYFSFNQSLDLIQILGMALILVSIWLLQTKGKCLKYLQKVWRDKMFKNTSNKKFGLILVLLAATFWGYVGVPTKHLVDLGFDNYTISFFKTSIPAIFYLIYSFKKDPSLFKVDKKGILFFIIYGIVVVAGCFIAFNITINLLPLALATMFLYTSQIWVVTISYFMFKEKFTVQKAISMLLILIGCFMMCEVHKLGSFNLSTKGIFWGLISGFTFALQIILAKVSSEKYHYNHNSLLTYSFLFAAIFLFPFMDMKNNIHIFQHSDNVFFLFKNIFWSVVGTLIANTAYVKSVEYIEASIASMVSSLELVIASVLGFIVFKQALNLVQILGMVLILVSIMLLEMKKENLLKLFKTSNKKLEITSETPIETNTK